MSSDTPHAIQHTGGQVTLQDFAEPSERTRLELIKDGTCPTCRKEYAGKHGVECHHASAHGNPAVTDGMLLSEIDRLHDELGRVPVREDMAEHGVYSDSQCERRFGGWNTALRMAGYRPAKFQEVPTEDLLEEIDRLHDELGRVPRVADMVEHGKYGTTVYRARFGGWNAALRESGHSPNQERDIPTEDLLGEIDRLHDELGRVPKHDEMDGCGRYCSKVYVDRFGGWSSALKEAGYEPLHEVYIPADDLLREIDRLYEELGHVPRIADMREHGRHSSSVYHHRFGGWNAALMEAGHPVNYEPNIPDDDLLDELHRLRDELGRVPMGRDMACQGMYSPDPYRDRFGGWNNALEAAGYDPPTRQYPTGEDHHNWNGGTARHYGPNWNAQRQRALERDDFSCIGCGRSREGQRELWDHDLHVHHKRPLTTFPFVDDEYNRDWEAVNALSNLMTCCTACHTSFESATRAQYPPDEYPRYIRPKGDEE